MESAIRQMINAASEVSEPPTDTLSPPAGGPNNLYWGLRAACHHRVPGVVSFPDTDSLPRLVEESGGLLQVHLTVDVSDHVA